MKVKIEDLEFEQLIDSKAINECVTKLGLQLAADYKDKLPIFIGVLNGSFIFFADLIKHIAIPCEISFTKLASYYGGTVSSLKIREDIDLSIEIKNRDIILIEDIVDTGNTLNYLLEKLKMKKPKSITVCTLLLKPAILKNKIPEIKYTGFEISDDFVIGYGLDYKESGRNLQGIFKKA